MEKLNVRFQIGWILSALFFMFLFNGCEKSTSDPNGNTDPNDLELSTELQSASKSSWQVLDKVNTNAQFSEMVAGNGSFTDNIPQMINSIPEVQKKAKVMERVYSYAQKSGSFSKIMTDSLIWFEEWTDPISGVSGRRALYYDPETEMARIYEVIYQFPSQVQLTYDSVEVSAFVGPSLEDSTDDQLRTFNTLSLFESGFFIESVESSVEATEYGPNNEVIGAMASNSVLYGPQTELLKLQQDAQLNSDGSAEISERLDYRDGTFLQRDVELNNDFTGSFSETWRDGTTVTGFFDLLEDDNHAAVSQTITFNNHPLLDKIEQSADYTVNPQDSSSLGILSEKVFFHNGDLDTSQVEIERSFQENHWEEHFLVQTSNDGQSDFVIRYFDTFKEIEGEHTDVDGLYTLFNGIEYEDGSGELWIEVYSSKEAYLAGEPPILTAHFIFGGDGSGSGEISENGQTYKVIFKVNGDVEVTDENGKMATLSVY